MLLHYLVKLKTQKLLLVSYSEQHYFLFVELAAANYTHIMSFT